MPGEVRNDRKGKYKEHRSERQRSKKDEDTHDYRRLMIVERAWLRRQSFLFARIKAVRQHRTLRVRTHTLGTLQIG